MIVCPGFIKTNLQQRALGGDGCITDRPQSMVGKPDTPENVAERVYQGARRKKSLLVLSSIGKIGYWINRITPSIYECIIEKKFRTEIPE